MRSYIDYLQQTLPSDLYPAGLSAWDGMPNFVLDTTIVAVTFLAVILLAPPCMSALSPSFAKLSPKVKHTAATYVAAIMHHMIVAPAGFLQIYEEYQYGPRNQLARYATCVPVVMGYFLADMLATGIPEALKGEFGYFIHHGVGLLLGAGMMVSSPRAFRWTPHFMICETSSFPLALGWALRKAGKENSTLCTVAQLLFALLFTLLRIVNLPLMTFAGIATHVQREQWDIPGNAGLLAFAGVLALVALQFMWWYKILLQVFAACCKVKKAGKKDPAAEKSDD